MDTNIMSEENNLSSNDLCITEDVFETFQANTMVEEEEYITLDDIVSPQPEVPDISNELNEIPYDNEIVLADNNDDTPYSGNIHESSHSTVNTQKVENENNFGDLGIANHHNVENSGTLNNTNKTQKRGRGRRKTKSVQNQNSSQSDSSQMETESNSFNNETIHTSQDDVHSTTVDRNGIESTSDKQGEAKYLRRTRRERIPNTARYPLTSEITSDAPTANSTPAKRRGRPKKLHETTTISEPDSTDTSGVNDNINITENSFAESAKPVGKRGRRGKAKAPQAITEPVNLNASSDKCEEVDNDNEVPLSELKKPTRRGRKNISNTIKDKPVESSVQDVQTTISSTFTGAQPGPEVHSDVQPEPGVSQLENDLSQDMQTASSTKNLLNSDHEQEDMDIDDDICLSKIKENINSFTENYEDSLEANMLLIHGDGGNEQNMNGNSNQPVIADFEETLDKMAKETVSDSSTPQNNSNSLLMEDTSKRPNRRKAKKNFKYDVDSDEDPFANVELSDDEPSNNRKKTRYNDDDEYIPSGGRGAPVTSSSESEINEDIEDGRKQKRKKVFSQSPRKRGRKSKTVLENSKSELDTQEKSESLNESVKPLSVDEDSDEPLSMKPPAEAWATSNAFENFIAQKIQGSNIKIKKLTRQKSESTVAPLEIPVLKPEVPKKFFEMSCQTSKLVTSTVAVQTSVPYDIPMKVNNPLTSVQSEKACEFLTSVVKTTAELGQLMKDKSEDFIKKKINTNSVTDTFKMDYCVRKSFLLFKLAKHNLMQMEEDLAKQYEEFLRKNNLSHCRDQVQEFTPSKKAKSKADSDSDFEIVDVEQAPSTPSTSKSTSKQNASKSIPKTVFLNKELSIKMAKKSTDLEVTKKYSVWINDSVMVKKVKPTQSFLAQDSRNKKPPDFVTEKMVSDFFENYYRQKAMAVCAPFVTTEWSSMRREYACHYFVKCNDFDEPCMSETIVENDLHVNDSPSDVNCSDAVEIHKTCLNNPKSLSSLCAEVVRDCLHQNNITIDEDLTCGLTDGKVANTPLSLFRLCYQSLPCKLTNEASSDPLIFNNVIEEPVAMTVLPLKILCYRRVVQLITDADPDIIHRELNESVQDSDFLYDSDSLGEDILLQDDDDYASLNVSEVSQINRKQEYVKSLFSLCVITIQFFFGKTENQNVNESTAESIYLKVSSPRSLKYIAYSNIKHLIFGDENVVTRAVEETNTCNNIVVNPNHSHIFIENCINAIKSEVAFHTHEADNEHPDEEDYDYEPEVEDYAEAENDGDYDDPEDDDRPSNGNEWISQVQMQVLSSCIPPPDSPTEDVANDMDAVTRTVDSTENDCDDTNGDENERDIQSTPPSTIDSISVGTLDNEVIAPIIKQEPIDDVPENIVDSSIVKTEPVHSFVGMTIIPESIITKSELVHTGLDDDAGVEADGTEVRAAYDRKTFEQVVKNNKMMHSMDDEEEEEDSDEDLFTRRGVERSEHVPDYDAGNDMNESLLVPHTFEPLHVDNAKGVLMESSSEENNDASAKTGKKKAEKKRRPKKVVKEVPKTNTKEIPATTKEVPSPVKDKAPNNEVAMLTRRMREKIRQEEKKIESSDSESDNMALSLRKDRNKAKEPEPTKPAKKSNQGESSSSKVIDNEIQCNNVDSTEQTLENKDKDQNVLDQFTGFSAIDQNEISSYQKFMKYVFDKVVPSDNDVAAQKDNSTKKQDENSNRSLSPLISPEEPIEQLECEPTLPMFDDDFTLTTEKRTKRVSKKKESKEKDLPKEKLPKDDVQPDKLPLEKPGPTPKFSEQDGWHIYPVDSSDTKLYQNCHIPLEKLPESFVVTYLEYQDITERDNIDKEVDRLANLNTLNRATNLKEVKVKGRLKSKSSNASEQSSANVSRGPSPALSDRFDELSPSEDEGANVDDEEPPPVPVRATENNLAKNCLMDDHDSDSDGGTKKKVKQEPNEPNDSTEVITENRKPGPKSKTKMGKSSKVDNLPPSESLMLTADKMMNKELNLLHAPIVMTKEEPKEASPKEPSPKDESKPKKRSLRNIVKERVQAEDDSSSEEEKQWVSTKEKLLKRVGKKEDAIADDAKRAKLVDDFIERRGEGHDNRRSSQTRPRRSRKKMLERMKQERALSKELFGESSMEAVPGSKRGAAGGLFKGRRNIRKVLDKKSLQKSTVLANMEEFERKRRLNSKQNQLRELLGYEEGVSVLVINDEVCLEYDFVEQRPVVTVHPFFTKVMKAHQYEGVKFMWDACFESLACIESGRGGGGCILAHCMGLGKTLQVLALLHTVLTHPRANMHRVLVCCPLSTVLNWVDEIHKWIGPVTDQIKVFELSKLRKTYERAYQLEDWYNGGGIFIIGYELFRSLTTIDPQIDDVRPTIVNKIRTALLDPGPDIIICDEGHLLKNDYSVLAVAMSRVATKRRIVLTGTPMQNNLREYYCMVNFVKPNLLGTYSEYSNRFENPIMNGQHRDSREEDIKLMKARTHILHKVLEGCLQRQEASVLYPYLPKKHEYTVFIPLTKCQWDLYKHYAHNYTKKNTSTKQNVLRDFHILQKIWSHPLVLHNFNAKKREVKPEKIEDDLALEDKEDIKPPEMDTWWLQYLADGEMLNSLTSSNKFVAVFRILDECIALGDKVLIFSTSLDCLDALECFLRQINGWNLGQEYYRLDGSVPAEVRQKWVREYNAETNHKTKLFLISTRAGCLGLNMTAANRVILLDTSWNPAHDIQSIFRVYRFGQKKDCYIYRLVAMGTMEQKIYERSVTKQAVACRVVDEQQIDRHYNMAELTELYKFDEHGVGVAGGVAVGVSDVALLRVARDSAIHAVHEHDSLLRGSGEQELPEYERAAAWMQFQQEHAHKQMQNDIETDNAARALKKLQDQQQLQEQLERQRQEEQQQLIEKQQSQVLNIKTEDGPVHDLLVPREVQPSTRGRPWTRGRGRSKVVQCRIPIKSNTQGPGKPISEEEMVQQISDILLQHNFTHTGQSPQQIKQLVAKVKTMVQTGQPMEMEKFDPLTTSIARVLMQKMDPGPSASVAPVMPALTDIEIAPRRRGRPKKGTHELEKSPQPEASAVVGRRLRRRAAIMAEQQFDLSDDGASQDSAPANPVIELDDDWQAASDTDSAPEAAPTQPSLASDTIKQEPKQTKPLVDEQTKKKWKTYNSKKHNAPAEEPSIVLSDEEPAPSPQPAKPATPPPAEPTGPTTPLHPSLLTNQNFIKIVAHTYLAGNPMLDEDAATLAAQYSTLKLLKEFESTGKPISSGPIYDIAIKVLGETVLKKLQLQPSDSKPENKASNESSAASSKMVKFLREKSPEESAPAPAPPAPAKKKIGPKSRVRAIKEEPQDAPKATPPVIQRLGLVPVDRLRKVQQAPAPAASEPRPAPPAQAAGECILPDDEDDVRCLTEPAPSSRPLGVIKLPNSQPSAKPKPAPVHITSAGVGPAPVQTPPPATAPYKTYATISLDSDDEEPPPETKPTTRTQRARGAAQPAPAGPVPVALTGPDSKPIPLAQSHGEPPLREPSPPPAQHTFYPYKSAIVRPPEPVPVSLTGPGTGPVPISLTGPDNRPVPISLTGPGFHSMPLSLNAEELQNLRYMGQAAPEMSYADMQQQPATMSSANIATSVPMSFASAGNSVPITFTVPASSAGILQPTNMPGGIRAMRFTLAPGQSAAALHRLQGPGSGMLLSALPVPAPNAAPAPASQPAPPAAPKLTKTLCKPGDILRLTATGQLEVIKRADDPNVVHTIDDDDELQPAPTSAKARRSARTQNNTQAQATVTSATKPPPAPKATPAPAPKAASAQKPAPASKASAATKPGTPTPPVAAPAAAAAAPQHSRAEEPERRRRRISSSSSDSSRSGSPDPLSILKDVVHIQAPQRKTKSRAAADTPVKQSTAIQPKPSTSQAKPTPTKQTPRPAPAQQVKDHVITQKLSDILSTVKARKSSVISANKAAANKTVATTLNESIDLTDVISKPTSSAGTSKTVKLTKPTNAAKNDAPTTVVGTSKNIILDGKSKSLTNKDMVDLTGQKNVQVTKVKTWKPPEKRAVVSADPPVAKKKKTEPMMLKDFDIDDIDDIIELD